MDFLTDLVQYVYDHFLYPLYPLLSIVLDHALITLSILAVLILWVGMAYKSRSK